MSELAMSGFDNTAYLLYLQRFINSILNIMLVNTLKMIVTFVIDKTIGKFA